jgi:hypothetical protein
MAAGLVMSMIPVLVLYMFFSEKFIKGMSAGAEKGQYRLSRIAPARPAGREQIVQSAMSRPRGLADVAIRVAKHDVDCWNDENGQESGGG